LRGGFTPLASKASDEKGAKLNIDNNLEEIANH